MDTTQTGNDTREALRSLVKTTGIRGAAKRLAITRWVVRRIIREEPVQDGTLALVRERLDLLRADEGGAK